MKRHTGDTVITAAVGHLDPATETELTEAERDHAEATFARLVATPNDETVPLGPRRPHRRRRFLAVTLGLAGAAVGVALPGLLLGGSAYGSWTPTPHALTSADASAAATTCRGALGVPGQGGRVAVAERRGEWTYLLLAAPGTEAICLMPNDLIGQELTGGGDFFGQNDPDAPTPPTLAPDRIDETTSMQGSTDEGWFIWTEGYVGSDVTGVTVHRVSGPDIEASVTGNRFAAWWPSKEQSSHQPDDTWSYTVHLADGSTQSAR